MKNAKKLAALVFIFAIAAAIIFPLLRDSGRHAETAQDAADYLVSRGIEAIFLAEKEITIPADFGEVYARYNVLQRESGFDLLPHRAHSAKLYTFSVPDASEAHVIVCCGKIIGGDISSAPLNGSMEALPD